MKRSSSRTPSVCVRGSPPTLQDRTLLLMSDLAGWPAIYQAATRPEAIDLLRTLVDEDPGNLIAKRGDTPCESNTR